jgi:hypothetical protein
MPQSYYESHFPHWQAAHWQAEGAALYNPVVAGVAETWGAWKWSSTWTGHEAYPTKTTI